MKKKLNYKLLENAFSKEDINQGIKVLKTTKWTL